MKFLQTMLSIQRLSLILCLLMCTCSVASGISPLNVDKAFQLDVKTAADHTVILRFKIAPSYYLYKNKFKFQIKSPKTGKIGHVLMPASILKNDPFLGEQPIYSNLVSLPIPIIYLDTPQATLALTYQGCSMQGYCYPPTTRLIEINFAENTTLVVPTPKITQMPPNKAFNLLTHHSFWLVVLGFVGFGLLLSFTPCILPMIPILSGIIMGHRKHLTSTKAFFLSLAYIIGVATTYASIGLLAGFVGGNIQIIFQKNWVILLFSLIFVLLALSLFGFYELKLPSTLENSLTKLDRKQKGGTHLSVFIMGALSSLIVSPCVTAPLIGVLGYIGKTGDALLGGIALFSLGFGMGIPLLLIGTAGGKFLPKAGTWMKSIESFFGILLLGVAIWLLEKILPASFILLLWGMLLIISSIYLGALNFRKKTHWAKFKQGAGLIILLYGILMIIGASMGHTDPFNPLKTNHQKQSLFTPVNSLNDLNRKLLKAKMNHEMTLLDFYADWCAYCKIMEKTLFQEENIREKMMGFQRLQIDVTKHTMQDKTLLHRFNIIAPPAILFFDPTGKELRQFRIVGNVTKAVFLDTLTKVSQH